MFYRSGNVNWFLLALLLNSDLIKKVEVKITADVSIWGF